MDKLGHLKSIVSKMKVKPESKLFKALTKYQHSDTFNYATNPRFKGREEELKNPRLEVWERLLANQLDNTRNRMPLNGFEELIALTEEGKLWKFPIDNEQGMDSEQQVPFEDHVFLDHLLDDFPKNQEIRNFMALVVSGLGKNPWMTVERKHEIIRFHKEYFESKRDIYKEAGFDI